MIVLRDIENKDVEVIASLLNNANIVKYLTPTIPFPYTVGDAKWWIDVGSKEGINKAIEYEGEFVGVIGVTPGSFEKEHSGEIGYWLGEKYWGKGIGTEAVLKMTETVFDTTSIIRLFAPVFSPNIASSRVLEKCGYYLEANQKKEFFKNGNFYDAAVYVKICS